MALITRWILLGLVGVRFAEAVERFASSEDEVFSDEGGGGVDGFVEVVLGEDFWGGSGVEYDGGSVDGGEVDTAICGDGGRVDVLDTREAGAGVDLAAGFDVEASQDSLVVAKVIDEAFVEEKGWDVGRIASTHTQSPSLPACP